MRLQDGKSGNRPAARMRVTMRFGKRRAKLEGAVKSWHHIPVCHHRMPIVGCSK